MGISYRNFLLDHEDHLYRFTIKPFEHMFDDPPSHPIELFAGQRVRMDHVAVQAEIPPAGLSGSHQFSP